MGEATVVAVRAVLTFITLLIFTRLSGKTQIAQLTFFEWVTGITIGSIGGVLSTDLSIRPWPVFVGLAVWVVLVILTQYVAMKSRWTGKMLDGEPVVVVQNGQILEKCLGRIRMRVGELNSLLREKDVFDISTVEVAVLEPHGKLSVLLRSQERPVTPKDLNIPTSYEGLGVELVVDGEVMMQNLRRMGLNQAWLRERLQEQGLSGPAEAFLAVIDTQGRIYVDGYADHVPPSENMGDYPGPN